MLSLSFRLWGFLLACRVLTADVNPGVLSSVRFASLRSLADGPCSVSSARVIEEMYLTTARVCETAWIGDPSTGAKVTSCPTFCQENLDVPASLSKDVQACVASLVRGTVNATEFYPTLSTRVAALFQNQIAVANAGCALISASPSFTSTASLSPTSSISETSSPSTTATSSASPTSSSSLSSTSTTSLSPSSTRTPSLSDSSTRSASGTRTPTSTLTATGTPTTTASASPTGSGTPSSSGTPTSSFSNSLSATASASPTSESVGGGAAAAATAAAAPTTDADASPTVKAGPTLLTIDVFGGQATGVTPTASPTSSITNTASPSPSSPFGPGVAAIPVDLPTPTPGLTAASGDPQCSSTQAPGMDLQCCDYQTLAPPQDDISLCISACCSDPYCSGYTYVSSFSSTTGNCVTAGQPCCFLKTGVLAPMVPNSAVAGITSGAVTHIAVTAVSNDTSANALVAAAENTSPSPSTTPTKSVSSTQTPTPTSMATVSAAPSGGLGASPAPLSDVLNQSMTDLQPSGSVTTSGSATASISPSPSTPAICTGEGGVVVTCSPLPVSTIAATTGGAGSYPVDLASPPFFSASEDPSMGGGDGIGNVILHNSLSSAWFGPPLVASENPLSGSNVTDAVLALLANGTNSIPVGSLGVILGVDPAPSSPLPSPPSPSPAPARELRLAYGPPQAFFYTDASGANLTGPLIAAVYGPPSRVGVDVTAKLISLFSSGAGGIPAGGFKGVLGDPYPGQPKTLAILFYPSSPSPTPSMTPVVSFLPVAVPSPSVPPPSSVIGDVSLFDVATERFAVGLETRGLQLTGKAADIATNVSARPAMMDDESACPPPVTAVSGAATAVTTCATLSGALSTSNDAAFNALSAYLPYVSPPLPHDILTALLAQRDSARASRTAAWQSYWSDVTPKRQSVTASLSDVSATAARLAGAYKAMAAAHRSAVIAAATKAAGSAGYTLAQFRDALASGGGVGGASASPTPTSTATGSPGPVDPSAQNKPPPSPISTLSYTAAQGLLVGLVSDRTAADLKSQRQALRSDENTNFKKGVLAVTKAALGTVETAYASRLTSVAAEVAADANQTAQILAAATADKAKMESIRSAREAATTPSSIEAAYTSATSGGEGGSYILVNETAPPSTLASLSSDQQAKEVAAQATYVATREAARTALTALRTSLFKSLDMAYNVSYFVTLAQQYISTPLPQGGGSAAAALANFTASQTQAVNDLTSQISTAVSQLTAGSAARIAQVQTLIASVAAHDAARVADIANASSSNIASIVKDDTAPVIPTVALSPSPFPQSASATTSATASSSATSSPAPPTPTPTTSPSSSLSISSSPSPAAASPSPSPSTPPTPSPSPSMGATTSPTPSLSPTPSPSASPAAADASAAAGGRFRQLILDSVSHAAASTAEAGSSKALRGGAVASKGAASAAAGGGSSSSAAIAAANKATTEMKQQQQQAASDGALLVSNQQSAGGGVKRAENRKASTLSSSSSSAASSVSSAAATADVSKLPPGELEHIFGRNALHYE